jgi:hypothetical protein
MLHRLYHFPITLLSILLSTPLFSLSAALLRFSVRLAEVLVVPHYGAWWLDPRSSGAETCEKARVKMGMWVEQCSTGDTYSAQLM